jgi:hypothetical protein
MICSGQFPTTRPVHPTSERRLAATDDLHPPYAEITRFEAQDGNSHLMPFGESEGASLPGRHPNDLLAVREQLGRSVLHLSEEERVGLLADIERSLARLDRSRGSSAECDSR